MLQLTLLISNTDISDKLLNPVALRKAKIVYNFGLSECSRVKSKKIVCRHFIFFFAFQLLLSQSTDISK